MRRMSKNKEEKKKRQLVTHGGELCAVNDKTSDRITKHTEKVIIRRKVGTSEKS